MVWADEFQFINKHTMFLLQLHPVYRAFYAVVYSIWGAVLLYYGTEHIDNHCAKDVAALAVVLGAALCVGALSLLIGLGTKKHRFQGDDFFPYPKILILDWVLTCFSGFFCFGILNFWYWGFVTDDDRCPSALKDVCLAYLIYCYLQLMGVCIAVVCIAFRVSGPSYIYQDVVYDIDPPDCLLKKFARKEQHNYGSTSLHVEEYLEPRLSGRGEAERNPFGGEEYGSQMYENLPQRDPLLEM